MLQALGFNINLTSAQSAMMLAKHNFCFLFAQKYHQAMRFVAPVRRTLGIRTIFNVLGPLANPAHAKKQVLGVYDETLLIPLAKTLIQLGVNNGKVIYGTDGLDEASISASTKVVNIVDGVISEDEITPEQFGLKRYNKEEIVGGTPEDNAKITREIIQGKTGAKRDVVLLNAGIAINTYRPDISIQQGIKMAQEAIDSGKTKRLLNELLTY